MRTKTKFQLSPPTSGSLSQCTVQTHKRYFLCKGLWSIWWILH